MLVSPTSNKFIREAYVKVLLAPQVASLQENCAKLCISDDTIRNTAKVMQSDEQAKISTLYLASNIAALLDSINYAIMKINDTCAFYGINPSEVLQ